MNWKKRLLALALCLCTALCCLSLAHAAEDGHFYLTAATDTATLIEPVRISYTAGQTVQDALLASDYDFNGLESGYIYAIEGVAGNFNRYYDGGGYDLSRPASEITALVFTERSNYSPELLELVTALGTFRERTDNARNYAPAAKAYTAAVKGLRSADAETATSLKTALESAVSDYEALLAGTKYTVSVTAMQAEEQLSAPQITMTDAYGNVTTASGSSVAVVAGDYTFSVSDGGRNRTDGKLTVSADCTLRVTLPSGDWFGDVHILDVDKNPLPETPGSGASTYYIPDTIDRTGLYLNAMIGGVPDQATTRLRTDFIDTNGASTINITRSWNSTSTALARLLNAGLEGRTFNLEAQYTGADGYVQIQTYGMEIVRVPTLRSLTATAEGTVLPLEFAPETLSYTLTTVSDTLELAAEAFGETGYTIEGAGSIPVPDGTSQHTVTVRGENGQSRDYTLSVTKKDAVSVTVTAPEGTGTAVFNAAGAEIAPVDGVYHLIPGEAYTCIGTNNEIYHTRQTFTAASGLTVTAAAPETIDALQALTLYNGSNASTRTEFAPETTFAPAAHSLSYIVPDLNAMVYAQANPASGYSVTASYRKQTSNNSTNGTEYSRAVTSSVSQTGSATPLSYCIAKCGYSQTVTLRLEKTSGGVTYYQDYTCLLRRSTHLAAPFKLSDASGELPLANSNGDPVSFEARTTDYYVTVELSSEALTINSLFTNMQTSTDVGAGYYAMIGGMRYDALTDVSIPLNTAVRSEEIEIQVCHADERDENTVYTIHVNKTEPVQITFATDPADANVYLVHNQTGRRIFGENGVYALIPGASYTYRVTRSGYVGVEETAYTAPAENATVTIPLTAAPDGGHAQLPAVWPSFRADDYNNGVVSDPIPTSSDEGVLYWATQLGEGYSADACGCPILVDGYVYTYAQTTLYKVDTISGKIVATGTMDHSSSFAINPPTYADGMIFVGLSDGTVQAFDASTLQSLWIYRDARKGQPNCPIVYRDGYLYTGFWLGETMEANYVCLSATDEDPTQSKETKLATWTYTSKGGFYWAGAYVSQNYLVVGTDDAEAGYNDGHASVLSLDPKSGALIDSVKLPQTGDVRSSMTFVPAGNDGAGTCYFTTKGGYFYSLAVDAGGKLGQLRALPLYNYSSDAKNPAMSTCTPTIYNGRAYVGVSGTSQFGAYSGHNITVIDLASWEIAYTVRTQGYPQTSGLLTTAYQAETGKVYVYFFDNFTPGKLRMLSDQPGQTEPAELTVEQYTASGATTAYNTGYVLFTPSGEEAQYAICSPITDETGTIYFKNDSARLMAFGSTIDRLEVTQQPDKTTYKLGETFKGDGLKVTAHYTNGTSRDVSDYVVWSEEPLTAEDTEFEIRFPYVKYQNADGEAGVAYPEPTVLLDLTIDGAVVPGDVNGDGKVTNLDAALTYACYNGTCQFTDEQKQAADVNGDGKVTNLDAAMIYAYYNGTLKSFDDIRVNH